MKGLLIVMVVLTMASMANAALYISVNGTENPPDSAVTLPQGQSCVIGVTGDGQTPQEIDAWLILEPVGVASMSGGVMLYTGDLSAFGPFQGLDDPVIQWMRDMCGYGGYNTMETYYMGFCSFAEAPLTGTLVDEIVLHCDYVGDVLLTLANIYQDDNYGNPLPPVIQVFDTQIIHQIPEPMTLGLLGLGGLFLRRRK